MKKSTKWIVAMIVTFGMVGAWASNSDGRFCDRGHQKHGELMMKKVSQKLRLDEAQQTHLRQLQVTMKEKMQGMKSERQNHVQEFKDLFGTSFDQSGAMSLLQKKSAKVNEHAPEIITAFAGFYDSLDKDQQGKLKKMAQKRGGKVFGLAMPGGKGRHGNHEDYGKEDH